MGELVQYVQLLAVPGIGVLLVALLAKVARHYVMKIEDDRLRALLLELVKAAEQIYGSGNGAEKLAYVQEQMARRGVTGVSREQVEAAVFDLQTARAGN